MNNILSKEIIWQNLTKSKEIIWQNMTKSKEIIRRNLTKSKGKSIGSGGRFGRFA
jgi:hypothetical protein